MSGGRLPTRPPSSFNNFSSTPIKTTPGKNLHFKGMEDDVLPDDEDTFSLLSPIYHDSYDSEEDAAALESDPTGQTSPSQSDDSCCELPRSSSGRLSGPSASPALSPWEMWLVNKVKEDRIRLEKKAEEEHLLKEKQKQQEKQQKEKNIIIEEKIHEWLKIKKEKEKREQLLKQTKEMEEMQRQQQKQKESEQKAQKKYKDWLDKKQHEKAEKEKKKKEEAALKEEQEKERRRRAEEIFKEWVAKANEKSRASSTSPHEPRSPYDISYPPPSFYNPIPWKPIHVPPPPESPPPQTTSKKPQKPRKSSHSASSAFRLRNGGNAAHTLQRR